MLSRVETIDAGFHRFHILYTVNLEKFREGFIFANAKFRKNKNPRETPNCKITLSFADIGKLCPIREFLNVANMSINAIRDKKILVKISEFTVLHFLNIITLKKHDNMQSFQQSFNLPMFLVSVRGVF